MSTRRLRFEHLEEEVLAAAEVVEVADGTASSSTAVEVVDVADGTASSSTAVATTAMELMVSPGPSEVVATSADELDCVELDDDSVLELVVPLQNVIKILTWGHISEVNRKTNADRSYIISLTCDLNISLVRGTKRIWAVGGTTWRIFVVLKRIIMSMHTHMTRPDHHSLRSICSNCKIEKRNIAQCSLKR